MRLIMMGTGGFAVPTFQSLLDCDDVDALVAAVVAQSTSTTFDVNMDGTVDRADVNFWVMDLAGTLLADADLDGTVDGNDFLRWNDHKFTSVAAWCSGDFNADGVVDGQDFLIWNDHKFMSASVAVPEPATMTLICLLICGLAAGRREICRRAA